MCLAQFCSSLYFQPFCVNLGETLVSMWHLARCAPFFLSERTLGDVPRPEEYISLHILQLNRTTLPSCSQGEVHGSALWDFSRAPSKGEGWSPSLLSFLPLLICNEDGMANASSSHLGSGGVLGNRSHMSGEWSRNSQEAWAWGLMTESCWSAWTPPYGLYKLERETSTSGFPVTWRHQDSQKIHQILLPTLFGKTSI